MEFDPIALKKDSLAPVPNDKVFWVCNGSMIASLQELADVVERLSPGEFGNHVNANGKRNDFAVWVCDVLRNPTLARDLNLEINLVDQKHFVKTVRDHLAWLLTL